ncbi:MarR family winged helix-turn-helix transcriptional regulator [Methylophaga sulfidovorans]|uniref:Transcriptional regulator, MarR family n=1 Tax=Methylophaga sulfidovorans TaxID=45496 RepID=A0A1I4B5L5_9GAMM|nr:MarR family transcriptional regulator [Methylophaga sulfidovorans]SFK64158.1 transcriptional regulator, MarR family [Methylophaga sulfidovorans]
MTDISAIETIRLLAHAVKKRLALQLEVEALGLVPMQVRLMKIIHRRSPCTALDIASFMQRDKAQITRLISGLLEQGLIEKHPNPKDKRSHFLLLTPEGDRIQESLSKLIGQAEQSMLEGIAKKDMQSFFTVTQKMLKNLEKDQ